jgi:excisionase family DNA binding protein
MVQDGHMTTNETPVREIDVPTPWYTKVEACQYLRVSLETLDRYVADGILVIHKVRGRQTVRLHRDDLDAALERIPPKGELP